jgi:3-deoxy-7-phosphoheptulonate synthase
MNNANPGKDISAEDLLTKFPLAARSESQTNSVVQISENVTFGGKNVPLIVGPNLVESEKLIFEIAEAATRIGANMLRGGCFKPLTFPYRSEKYFETGEDGLKWLSRAGKHFNIPVVTEAVSEDQIDLVAKYSDVIQIGTRNMQNYPLLVRAAKSGKPILLKRGYGSSLRDFLGAAEYILFNKNKQLILCERGITAPHTHRSTSRFLLDIQIFPAAKEVTHLPIISDPSHASFWSPWVPSLVNASIAVGADGIMLETHPNPSKAAVDPLQAIDFKQLEAATVEAKRVAIAIGRTLGC